VTQERDLDEFLNTAQLAGTEFTAGIGLYLPSSSEQLIIISHRTEKRQDHTIILQLSTQSIPAD
jgi:hypothetical protein